MKFHKITRQGLRTFVRQVTSSIRPPKKVLSRCLGSSRLLRPWSWRRLNSIGLSSRSFGVYKRLRTDVPWTCQERVLSVRLKRGDSPKNQIKVRGKCSTDRQKTFSNFLFKYRCRKKNVLFINYVFYFSSRLRSWCVSYSIFDGAFPLSFRLFGSKNQNDLMPQFSLHHSDCCFV